MTHRLRSLLTLLATGLALSACGGDGAAPPAPASPPAATQPPPPALPEPGLVGDSGLTGLVDTVRRRHAIPALGAVVVRQGAVAEKTATGRRAVDVATAVTVDDRWHIGSLTKAMTATLAGVLVEQSVLRWDMTPQEVWPGLAPDMHPHYLDVTIEQMLAHLAGFPVDVGEVPSFAAIEDSAPGTLVDKRRLWAAELLKTPPRETSGGFLYTNAGYVVVGAMMETLTGASWEQLVREQLFGPLQMTQTGFGAPGTPGACDQPCGHDSAGGRLRTVLPGPGSDNVRAIGPAGTVHTTLDDYARFIAAHLAGARGIDGIVTTTTFSRLHTPPAGAAYALGWEVERPDFADGMLLQHAGSNRRWLAQAGLLPALDAGILIVTNAASTEARNAVDELSALLAERILASQ